VLLPVYQWFTEGLATADLIAARETLDAIALGASPGRSQ
jgi:hypothetical protein